MKKVKRLKKLSTILSILAVVTIMAIISVNTFAGASLPVVNQGASGPVVTAIQYLLKAHGYSLSVDGDFGSGTLSAVKSFQKAKGLVYDGKVGQNTWEELFVTVKSGSNGDAVRAVQYLLRYKHNYSLDIDGDFGPTTKSKIVSFQSSKGISADGIVGPNTWAYLVGTSSSAPTPAPGGATISFGSGINSSVVSSHTLSVIQKVLAKAGLNKATITSTIRTPESQAAAMYTNCVSTGAGRQKDLYGPNGDAVIDVYISGVNRGLSKATIISNMTAKIEALWPAIVSKHCVSPSQYSNVNVVDIGYSSIANHAAFRIALNQAVSNGSIKTFIDEPENSCFHIEVAQ